MSSCPQCTRMFATSKAMKKHHTTEHNSHLLRFPCEWCGQRYLTEANMLRHAAQKHPDIQVRPGTYQVFDNNPRAQATTPSRPKPTPSTVRFQVMPGVNKHQWAPKKVVKHQGQRDRSISPAVPPTPTSPGTPTDEAAPNTTAKLNYVCRQLAPLASHATTNPNSTMDWANLLRRDLSMSDSPNESVTTISMKRKNTKTPVCSGVKKPRLIAAYQPLEDDSDSDVEITRVELPPSRLNDPTTPSQSQPPTRDLPVPKFHSNAQPTQTPSGQSGHQQQTSVARANTSRLPCDTTPPIPGQNDPAWLTNQVHSSTPTPTSRFTSLPRCNHSGYASYEYPSEISSVTHSKNIPCTTGPLSFGPQSSLNIPDQTPSTRYENYSTMTRPLNRSERFNIGDMVHHLQHQPRRMGPIVMYDGSTSHNDSSDIVRPPPNREEIIGQILHLTARLNRQKLLFMREICNLIFPIEDN